jgi:hypothetical protein
MVHPATSYRNRVGLRRNPNSQRFRLLGFRFQRLGFIVQQGTAEVFIEMQRDLTLPEVGV